MKEIVSSPTTSTDLIKPLELGKYKVNHYNILLNFCISASEENRIKDRRKVSDGEEKTLSDELVDFMEEVTEEFLDTVMPDDD